MKSSTERDVVAAGEGRIATNRFPPIAGHVSIGLVTAVVMVIADVVQSSLRDVAPRVTPGQLAVAGLHLAALYGLVGVVAGAGIGIVARWLRRSRVTSAALARASSIAFWTRGDPPLFASGVANGIAAALIFGLVAWGHVDFSTRFHRADLAGYALGAVVLVAVVVVLAVRAALASGVRAIAFRMGRLASLGALVAVLLAGVIAAVVIGLVRHPEILLAYDARTLAWPAGTALAWLVVALLLVRPLRRARPARVRALAAFASALVMVGLVTSAATFGDSNRVRSVVEQRSVVGRRLVRMLQATSDRDGDRYAWAFGGGDCDDGDPRVHPGAIDVEGDGIDSDCFAGDGAPRIVERGRGQFGDVPSSLVRPNFLVVTIDALRRDHLGAYGYPRPTSPHIDAFAREAIDFREVVPQSSRSLRSIPAMWTGNYASEIAFGPEYLWPSLLPENVTAPELLRDHGGYATSVIMATEYFRRMDDFFQGFDQVTQFEIADPPRERAVNQALPELRRLASGTQPWLFWVHLYNCHVPYLQDGVPSRYGHEQVDLYDTEIGFADEQFQRLLDALDELGLRDRTVVVLASDHGEGFGEHGTFGHSTTLYEEEMRSVLMMRIPGVAPRRVEHVVGLLDVAPTILNLAQVQPTEDLSGISLVPFATGAREPDPERPVFAELLPDGLTPYDVKVMRRGVHKLMWWVRDGTFQYFHLEADPDEHHDLSDARREEAEAMLGSLRAWVASSSRAENRSETFVAQNRLRAVPAGISHPTDIRYPGMFTLAGFDLPRTRFTTGDDIPLTFYYRVDAQISRDLFFLVDIEAPPGVRLPAHFHAWHWPLHSRYPTTRWEPGEVVRDPTPIVIPEGVPTPVRLGLYLRVRDGGELLEATHDGRQEVRVHLADIEVEPSPPSVATPR
ncbi:sulfatase-like hydrolase/transferase [Sandaracinus amylolyticus]|uniref:sulfatase-like hydrolase/transferase n=1 Tax=Sandaracinus amylolyticus TaxID=927083 RepID=UPI001F1A69EF|nr:sulfatase-like hydrolase/transferase [Sandaracinus amylolyticus]UJR81419.1 Choline-sulfatase [Sandaracinus amylolyticus]